ncbi:reverse transcriptase, partial [Lasius niger]
MSSKNQFYDAEGDQSEDSDVGSGRDCKTVRDQPTDSHCRRDNQAGSSGDAGSRGDPFPPLTTVSGKELARRTQSDECRHLEEENSRLRVELDCFKREMSELKAEVKELRRGAQPPPPPAPAPPSPMMVSPSRSPTRKTKSSSAGGIREKRSRPSQEGENIQPTNTAGIEDTLVAAVLRQVGAMLDARLAVIEERLPPEGNLRPPLRADEMRKNPKSGSRIVSDTVIRPAPTTREGGITGNDKVTSDDPQVKKKKGKKKRSTGVGNAAIKADISLLQAPVSSDPRPKPLNAAASYSAVVRRGRAGTGGIGGDKNSGAGRTQKSKPPPRAADPHPKKAGGKGKGKEQTALPNRERSAQNKGKKRKIRPPKQAAIHISMPPRGETDMDTTDSSGVDKKRTMGEVMQTVKGEIKLSDYQITSLRPKRTVTGGILYEVPGTDSAEKADKLAVALKALLEPRGLRVTRPVKRAELRVFGLDDATTPEDVVQAVAEVGGCLTGDIKIGKINQSPVGRLGLIWVQCPASAAKKVVGSSPIPIGWIRARVEALEARPLQCFRCLGVGHTRAQCKEEVDRSGLCYRCGQPGHKAAECSAESQCPHCKEIGRHLPGLVLVAGDLNAKSVVWGSPATNARGEVLEEWAAELGLLVLNRGSVHTCVRHNGGSIVDITLGTPPVARMVFGWRVMAGSETLSDHRYIRMDVSDPSAGNQPRPQNRSDTPLPPRWALKRLDKDTLMAAAVAKAWESPAPGPCDVDGEAAWFREAMTQISDVAMPRTRASPSRKSVYWWTQDIAQLRVDCVRMRHWYTRCRRRHTVAEAATLYETYREAKKSLQRAIRRAKTKAWDELLETLDDDPWGRPYLIVRKKLQSGGPPVTESLHPRVLEDVVSTLFPPAGEESIGPPGQAVRVPQSQRWTADLGVTKEELAKEIRRLGTRNAAPGPDGIHGRAWVLALGVLGDRLRRLFTACLKSGRFPPIWKEAGLVLLRKEGRPAESPSA